MTTDESALLARRRRPAVPLCLHCLQPHDPLLHYCPNCFSAVGQFTPNIPFVNIPYQCEFWARLWKKIWSDDARLFTRILGIFMIISMVPIMLVGLPFLFFWRRTPQGFEVLPPPTDPPEKTADEP